MSKWSLVWKEREILERKSWIQISDSLFIYFAGIKGTQGRMQFCSQKLIQHWECLSLHTSALWSHQSPAPSDVRFHLCRTNFAVWQQENYFAFTAWSNSAVAFVPKLWCPQLAKGTLLCPLQSTHCPQEDKWCPIAPAVGGGRFLCQHPHAGLREHCSQAAPCKAKLIISMKHLLLPEPAQALGCMCLSPELLHITIRCIATAL